MDSGKRTFYLGRYNCVEQLGTGPLGDTFRAKIYGVAGFEKQFAVKRLHANLTADDPFVARFVPAASAFAALDHQRIARVHEVNAQGAHYYIVIDLVRGLDLRRILELLQQRGEAVPPDVAMLIGAEIAEGLEYAHGRTNVLPGGVLHLGLTAQSVMVTYEGEVKLVDVGLLAALIQPGWSNDDALAPTLAYLSPEQLRGDTLDGRADLFSLGVVLHELISGSRLFLSDRAADLRAAIEGGPPPPPVADPRLQQIITSALNPDRDLRFRGAAELRAALQAILNGRAERARTDLSALVRRLAAPRERRTGAFASVTLPPMPSETVTPVGPAKPPPLPAHVWAPPVPKPPIGPMLSTGRTHNTLAGLGPDDAVLTPIELIELPGLPTEKGMSVVADEASTEAIVTVSPTDENGVDENGVDENGVIELTMTAEPESVETPEAATNGDATAATVTPTTAEPSWTPPVVEPPSPSPEPVFAEPLAEAHAPVEPPSSPVPGVKLPPRRPSSWAAFAIIGVLLVGGGIAIYAGMTASDGQKPGPNTQVPNQLSGNTVAPTNPTAANPGPAGSNAPAPANPATGSTAENPTTAPSNSAEAAKQGPTGTSTTAVDTAANVTKGDGEKKAAGEKLADGAIEIVTTPPGASLYIDGEPQGTTPAHVNVTAGKHHVVLVAEHQKLVQQDVSLSPHEPLNITLEEAKLPSEIAGPAGLKVRCKATQGELRLLVDGADTGLACPNDERISVKPGPHRIGLYSPRTDETHEIEHDVLDGTNSTRVYTKY
jgi:serine/threonine-protein kinase